jgi:hypothetical protein
MNAFNVALLHVTPANVSINLETMPAIEAVVSKALGSGKWVYVQVSVGDESSGTYYLRLLVNDGSIWDPTVESVAMAGLIEAPAKQYINKISLGCMFDANSKIQATNFSGIIREFKYISKAIPMDISKLEAYRSYYEYSYFAPELEAYWRLDKSDINETGEYLRDSSKYRLEVKMLNIGPRIKALNSTQQAEIKKLAQFNYLINCLDIFGEQPKQYISLDVNSLPEHMLLDRINPNISAEILDLFSTNTAKFYSQGCKGNYLTGLTFKRQGGQIIISDVEAGFVQSLAPHIGEYIDICLQITNVYYQIHKFYLRKLIT